MRSVLEKVDKYKKEFKDTFGVPIIMFIDPLFATIGVCSFDIVGFDKYMHNKGYTEEEYGSLNNYTIIKYGERAAKLIEELLELFIDKDLRIKEDLKMVNQKKVDLIMDIVDRGWEKMKTYYKDKLSMMMDIDTANRDCPLKLQELLKADEFNFYHDITGIYKNLNRKTKKLENCFLPRFAK
jgi:hypothetical protein